ncbi:glyoxalase [soil metagenome]
MERSGFVPYLHCPEAGSLADWLVSHLGFTEQQRWIDAEGHVANVELASGATEVWLDGGGRWWSAHAGDERPWVGLWVDDVDEAHARLASAGVEVSELVTRDFGVRLCEVTDPAGNRWGLMTRVALPLA